MCSLQVASSNTICTWWKTLTRTTLQYMQEDGFILNLRIFMHLDRPSSVIFIFIFIFTYESDIAPKMDRANVVVSAQAFNFNL